MKQYDEYLTKREKQERKKMRLATRVVELHLEINKKPKPIKYKKILAKMNSERKKHGLESLTEPLGFKIKRDRRSQHVPNN